LIAAGAVFVAGALPAGFATGLAAAFGAALGALFFRTLRACGAALRAGAEDFDFAAVFSAVFLDFATALAMSDNNPKRGVEDARLTPF
jgi:threonine/homoserine/homoserine lactone efflux protein